MKVSRIHRLLRLLTMLQAGHPYQVNDLARDAKVSRRTLFRDLNLLKLAGVPLAYDQDTHRFAIGKNFFLPPIHFTMSEALGLMMLVQKIGSRATLPNFDTIVAATTKIESTLPYDIQQYCGSALDRLDFRHAPVTDAARAGRVFERLWQAAQKCESLDLVYDSYYEKREIRTRLDPYRLMFISRAWYVIGYSRMHRKPRTFKLERILDAKPTGSRFRSRARFDPASYFGNAWQMIRGNKRHHVRIRFSPKVGGNVEEVLWHPTQQTQRLEDGSLLYEVDVDGVEEMSWWVLGYGKEAVVESPAELRTTICQHIRSLSAAYNGSMV